MSPLNLDEKLPATPLVKPFPAFYSPQWIALHEDVPRYVYHVPDGKVAFGMTLKAYRIQEPEYADTFGRRYREYEYIWLSLKPIYYADAYVVDLLSLNNDDLRFTGQAEGNLLHRGDIPASAVVAIRKADGTLMVKDDPSSIPTGTCYQDAWRFLMKQEEGYLVHGSVQLSAEGARVNHAWIETTYGWVWEPQTGQYFTIEDFKIFAPIEDARYSAEEAAIMIIRTGKHGPWSIEENKLFRRWAA